MTRRFLLGTSLLVAIVAVTGAQTPPPAAPRAVEYKIIRADPTPPAPPTPTQPVPPIAFLTGQPLPIPSPATLDGMLDQLELVQQQIAALQQREAAMKKAIAEKAGTQSDRMKKLGVIGMPAPTPDAPVTAVPAVN